MDQVNAMLIQGGSAGRGRVSSSAARSSQSAGNSFGSVLGGLSAESGYGRDFDASAELTPEEKIEGLAIGYAGDPTVMSDSSMNAVRNLIGAYLKSKADADSGLIEGSSMLSEWNDLLSSLENNDVSQIYSFVNNMKDLLFTDSIFDSGGKKNITDSGDLFSVLVPDLKEQKKNSDILNADPALMLSASGYSMYIYNAVDISEMTDITVEEIPEISAAELAAGTAVQDILSETAAQNVQTENLQSVGTQNGETTDTAGLFRQAVNDLAAKGSEETAEFADQLSDTVKKFADENGIKLDTEVSAEKPSKDMQTVSENDIRKMFSQGMRDNLRTSENREMKMPRIELPGKGVPDKRLDTDEENLSAGLISQTDVGKNVPAAAENIPSDTETEELAKSVNRQAAEHIEQLLAQNNDNGEKQLTVRLSPRSLGEITINLSKSENGALTVTIAAHNQATAKLMNDHTAQLLQMLTERSESTQVRVNVVDPAQSGQYTQLDMGGGNAYYYGRGNTSHTGKNTSGGNSGGDDDSEFSAAGTESIDTTFISREAMLWTTA